MNKPEEEENFLSFLDVIACAFGAIVLLVLILPMKTPDQAENTLSFSDYAAAKREYESAQLQLAAAREEDLEAQTALAAVRRETTPARGSRKDAAAKIQRKLDELRALNDSRVVQLDQIPPRASPTSKPRILNSSLGIPVDSDFLIFVVDTSGSMQTISADVARAFAAFLDSHPESDGFQVLSDEGEPLFAGSRGRWMTDSPGMRMKVRAHLQAWKPYSNSSPIEGIESAVNEYFNPGIKLSIIVVGDDHNQSDFDAFIQRVDRAVQRRGSSKRDLRIHAVGFENEGHSYHPERFGILMRALTQRYNGAFIYLSTSTPSKISINRGERFVTEG